MNISEQKETLTKILFHHDPQNISIIEDEYAPEAQSIIDRIFSVGAEKSEIAAIVYDEFRLWFGDITPSHNDDVWTAISEDMWVAMGADIVERTKFLYEEEMQDISDEEHFCL